MVLCEWNGLKTTLKAKRGDLGVVWGINLNNGTGVCMRADKHQRISYNDNDAVLEGIGTKGSAGEGDVGVEGSGSGERCIMRLT